MRAESKNFQVENCPSGPSPLNPDEETILCELQPTGDLICWSW